MASMNENLKSFLDEVFDKTPGVFYIDSFIEEIVKLPIPVHLKAYSADIVGQRRSMSRDYLLERCDCFSDSGICIKHGSPGDLAMNVATIHPESTLYIFDSFDTFIHLREYYRKNRSISINISHVSHIKTETGSAGSSVSTIYLTDDKIA